MQTRSAPPTLKTGTLLLVIALVFFLFLLSLQLYTFTHESGHALIGTLFGGTLTSFNISFIDLSAHVTIDGNFLPWQRALISLAGVTLPLLLWILFMGWVAAAPQNILLNWFKTLLFMVAVNPLLAWVILPLLTTFGQTAEDDSVNFMRITQAAPGVISAAALLIYLLGWGFFLRQMGGWAGISARLRAPLPDLKDAPTRKTLLLLILPGALVLAFTLAIPFAIAQGSPSVAAPAAPAGYLPVADLRLSERGYQDEVVYRFKLESPAQVSLFFALTDVQGGPSQLKLVGKNGYENIFLAVQDPKSNIRQGSVHPQQLALAKGEYTIRATLQPSQGRVKVYFKQD